ncbi:MAG: IS66 family transposase [Thermoanaerobaculia bacterium]
MPTRPTTRCIEDGLVEVGCWAHARRIFDGREQDPEAMKVLALIGNLYEVGGRLPS